MRASGFAVVIVGLLLQLVTTGYFTAVSVFELYQDWEFDTLNNLGKVANVVGFVGLAAILLGVVLLALAPRSPRPRAY